MDIFIADLTALLEELRTAFDNHDLYAAEAVTVQLEQLVKGHNDGQANNQTTGI